MKRDYINNNIIKLLNLEGINVDFGFGNTFYLDNHKWGNLKKERILTFYNLYVIIQLQ